ncbi:hypothetical protein C8R43DRAFT_305953 [Mycena crocata]|nr:hypothetical protein C8R43DRAFT_305953 [Mycena crocata]
MSIHVDGVQALNVQYSGLPHTVLSGAFLLRLYSPDPSTVLLTTHVAPYGSFSVPVPYEVEYTDAFDVVLGLDWAAYLRESLLGIDLRLDHSFSAWDFLCDPARPLSMAHLLSAASLSSSSSQYPSDPDSSLSCALVHRLFCFGLQLSFRSSIFCPGPVFSWIHW